MTVRGREEGVVAVDEAERCRRVSLGDAQRAIGVTRSREVGPSMTVVAVNDRCSQSMSRGRNCHIRGSTFVIHSDEMTVMT